MLVTRSKYRQRTSEQIMPGKSIPFFPEFLKELLRNLHKHDVKSHMVIKRIKHMCSIICDYQRGDIDRVEACSCCQGNDTVIEQHDMHSQGVTQI